MTDSEYRSAIKSIVYLCSCGINDLPVEKERLASVNLDHLYATSQKHMLSAIVGIELEKCGMANEAFNKAISLAKIRQIIFEAEFERVAKAMETEQIWYMVMKGAIIKDLYPVCGMREMSDYDVLIDCSKRADVKRIMEQLGFQTTRYGISHDDMYFKPVMTTFEMHNELFEQKNDNDLYDYYHDVKNRLIQDKKKPYSFSFTKEDFYLYMIAHEYKHFRVGGTGLRSLLDTYVYLKKCKIDEEYIQNELVNLGISEYERKNRRLALALFDFQELSDEQIEMLDYIAYSGTYGTLSNKVHNRVKARGGKAKYIFHRIIGPIEKNNPHREQFINDYKLFFRFKPLLVFLPAYRLIRAIRKRPGRLKREIKALKQK